MKLEGSFRFHKSPQTNPTLDQFYAVHRITFSFLGIHFNIIFGIRLRLRSGGFLSGLTNWTNNVVP
jgi:hypothetical protein